MKMKKGYIMLGLMGKPFPLKLRERYLEMSLEQAMIKLLKRKKMEDLREGNG